MSVRFATGKESWFICDRCGQRYRYTERKKEWTGVLACRDCFETKHPQLTPPKNVHDAFAIREARPDREDPLTLGDPAMSGGLRTPLDPMQIPIPNPFVYPVGPKDYPTKTQVKMAFVDAFLSR